MGTAAHALPGGLGNCKQPRNLRLNALATIAIVEPGMVAALATKRA